MSAEARAPDPVLPWLGAALDSASMREALAKALRPTGNPRFQVRDCRLERFRYRQARRANLLYELTVAAPGTGGERKQWVSGVIYPGDQARRTYDKLRAEAPERTIPGPRLPFEPLAFIPELRMLVQVFPFDRRLPSLALLTAAPPPELEPRLLDGFGPGDWKLERCAVETVRYRVGLGATVQYTIAAREAATKRHTKRCFYVKLYRDDKGAETCRLLRELRDWAAAAGPGFTVPRPLAYSSDLRALVLEAAPGTSLEQVLRDGGDAEDAVRRVARALAGLHLGTVTTTRERSRDEVLARARRAGTYLRWALPRLSAEIEGIIGAIEAGLEEAPPCPVHLDLKPDHVFLDGGRVVFVDLDSFAASDPVLDPATLLARIEALPKRFPLPQAKARAYGRAFVEEYFAHVPGEWRGRLPLDYACAALNVALYFLQHQEERWPEKVAATLGEARRALRGEGWFMEPAPRRRGGAAKRTAAAPIHGL